MSSDYSLAIVFCVWVALLNQTRDGAAFVFKNQTKIWNAAIPFYLAPEPNATLVIH
jgi:hypothetical protein